MAPHRDPETGQFLSGNGGMNLSYAEHDVHHVRHSLEYLNSADAGPSAGASDVRQFEITERGLDPDELAELRAITVQATLVPGGNVIPQDEIGGIRAVVESGFNLSADEFVLSNRDTEGLDVDSSGTDDFTAGFNDTDEVGQLTAVQLGGYPGYSDTTDGTGGAGGLPQVQKTIAFPGLTGTGPVVDAVDDFSSKLFLRVENMVGGASVEAVYSLYYAVEESESGRTRFGR